MVKIYIDPGHGGTDPGAQGNGLKEKDITLKVGKMVNERLDASGFDTRMSRTRDAFPSLAARTNDANKWGADLFISIYVNAGGGEGYEDYRYNKLSSSSTTGKQQTVIHIHMKAKAAKFGMKDRGAKAANFHVLRETKMSAVLVELGFIDSRKDSKNLKDTLFPITNGLGDCGCSM
ncbi:N-acetylmuramoyl-L-alanine amidase family protein [Terribacillus saccharophilus]|uniref:N-acetylmuramoyl-L-alanine amidase family protein n=1 Tax=Terribacillus saccharophilus TaxID=361277 RepID=UPI0027BA3CC9|nr:N-acetylmuramoyl-L-alanine amidase [Terribacillus saccharophilus]